MEIYSDMAPNKCPDCGSQNFYVKDPGDQYAITEFEMRSGEIIISDTVAESDPIEIVDETETFCDRCAWHDKFKTLK